MTISHPHSQYKFYKVISFTSSSATFKFTKWTQIFREQYLMNEKTVFSALQIGSAYENSHSTIMGCFCKDHSCINTTDPLTGRTQNAQICGSDWKEGWAQKMGNFKKM